ncbi:T9SS type A sorting domain-containing protein [Flavobacterium sp. J372]|uniref:T9SS type A sorting domain-containing protein n=1 Tax=Flavobacterium sp. J372 TaxID=2898436 RepID=UPI002151B686|nr:T9SS type A sorting domain-containing protein [Flavobacterium sp. J372]MCR5861024.1 T9SS type A sorting domain-containing protein [Flavobacterium sp. J372]
MRNVYLYIGLFMLFGINCFGQNLQNANWYFGDHGGLKFIPPSLGTALLNGSAMTPIEGCATVSDQAGTLLFYTDGRSVYNAAHTVMPNSSTSPLIGDDSSTQAAVVVPVPGSPQKYYIFTISGLSGTPPVIPPHGLYYSIVDMSLPGGGDVVLPNNTPLLDHLSVPITTGYGTSSEKMTSAKHSNGIDYWIVAQIRGWVYSYHVTATSVTLSSFTAAPVTINHGATNSGAALGQMKISPNGQRIGIAYRAGGAGLNTSPGEIALGSFNNTTGLVIFDPVTIQGGIMYGLEFSPDSQLVYYITGTQLVRTANTTSLRLSIPYTQSGSLQLGIDGRIYCAARLLTSLPVITNPNNFASPGFISAGAFISGKSGSGLPQWVHWHEQQPCTPLTLTSESYPVFNYNNRSSITAHINYNIVTSTDIQMHARDFIVLQPNVHIASGSNYWASIQDCEGGGITERQSSQMSSTVPVKDIRSSLFSMYPNPAHDRLTVSAEAGITTVTISSIEGMLMYSTKLSGKETSQDVDVSQYRKGIYIVNITTADGKTESQKLVKD